jgi:hypothetical protein
MGLSARESDAYFGLKGGSMRIVLAALIGALALSACSSSIKQVNPVTTLEVKRICIIENPRVIFDFVGAYRKALEERGIQVQVLPDTATLKACPLTSKYTANLRWDLVTYLSYAEISVYSEGQPVGRAIFTAGQTRFFSTDDKIKELADELFKR